MNTNRGPFHKNLNITIHTWTSSSSWRNTTSAIVSQQTISTTTSSHSYSLFTLENTRNHKIMIFMKRIFAPDIGSRLRSLFRFFVKRSLGCYPRMCLEVDWPHLSCYDGRSHLIKIDFKCVETLASSFLIQGGLIFKLWFSLTFPWHAMFFTDPTFYADKILKWNLWSQHFQRYLQNNFPFPWLSRFSVNFPNFYLTLPSHSPWLFP